MGSAQAGTPTDDIEQGHMRITVKLKRHTPTPLPCAITRSGNVEASGSTRPGTHCLVRRRRACDRSADGASGRIATDAEGTRSRGRCLSSGRLAEVWPRRTLREARSELRGQMASAPLTPRAPKRLRLPTASFFKQGHVLFTGVSPDARAHSYRSVS